MPIHLWFVSSLQCMFGVCPEWIHNNPHMHSQFFYLRGPGMSSVNQNSLSILQELPLWPIIFQPGPGHRGQEVIIELHICRSHPRCSTASSQARPAINYLWEPPLMHAYKNALFEACWVRVCGVRIQKSIREYLHIQLVTKGTSLCRYTCRMASIWSNFRS